MNPTRSVVYAQLISILIILLGGRSGITKLRNGINATVGRPVYGGENISTNTAVLSSQVFTGWAIVFVILVGMADNETVAPLAVGFAYLLLLSIALAVGPDALGNVQSLVTTPTTPSDKTRITDGRYGGKIVPD